MHMIHSIQCEKTKKYYNKAHSFVNLHKKTLLQQQSTLVPSPSVKSKVDENHIRGVCKTSLRRSVLSFMTELHS